MTDHANELRRYSRKIGHPAGDVPSVMLAAADEIERLAARLEAAEKSDAESLTMYRKARDERDALRAKIEAMEQQEPPRGWWDDLIADISAIDCMYRGWPTYAHDAYWMRDRVVWTLKQRRDSTPGVKGE
jgi:hypothetical protein